MTSASSTLSTDIHLERLRLKPDTRATGSVDGAWWPASRELTTEFSDLAAALGDRIGPVERVSYNLGAWDSTPRRLRVGDRVVRFGGFRSQEPAVVTVIANRRRLNLLVVPPETDARAAEQILAAASRDGNVDGIDELLSPAHR